MPLYGRWRSRIPNLDQWIGLRIMNAIISALHTSALNRSTGSPYFPGDWTFVINEMNDFDGDMFHQSFGSIKLFCFRRPSHFKLKRLHIRQHHTLSIISNFLNWESLLSKYRNQCNNITFSKKEVIKLYLIFLWESGFLQMLVFYFRMVFPGGF